MEPLHSRETQPQLQAILEGRTRLTIGLPRCNSGDERRFPLTPESVGMLVERGCQVLIEEGAAASLRYTDMRYQRHGAVITTRANAFRADIVIHLAPLSAIDAGLMRRGGVVMTLHAPEQQNVDAVFILMKMGITAIALDRIVDSHDQHPFFDILAEIDGRAAIACGTTIMLDPVIGKGVLLGGATGVVPCEVFIIGAGMAGRSAAKTAIGQGSIVRLFDNDIYRLRKAENELGSSVICSALNPHVLTNAMRSADIVLCTRTRPLITLDDSLIDVAKDGALFFDLVSTRGNSFSSLPAVDSCDDGAIRKYVQGGRRFCIVNPGARVARTTAMSLSNVFLSLFDEIKPIGDIASVLHVNIGMRHAVYTFRGRVVDPEIARQMGLRQVDIDLFLSMS